ncbi:MAG: methyltransferase domain-containing protein [Planctomycetia bacterium]|nr:methyltransferase domain-containing protein [Planctomycetia bacterium]
MPDDRLRSDRFPRSNKYHPDWVIANAMGSNCLWLAEWLTDAMDLKPGLRVLDLGCGRAVTSIFLAREFGVQVFAADLWIGATENQARIDEAGVGERVFPLHVDAHSLPFAGAFFDAILCVDAFSYFGTDDLYLNYLAHFVKPGCPIAIAGAGLVREMDGPVPEHLRPAWTQDFWSLHSAAWWRKLWERTGIVDIEVADDMPGGWRAWLDWQTTAHPENRIEIDGVAADGGACLAYVRVIGRRRGDAKLEDYCWPDTLRSFPLEYEKKPLLRDDRAAS